MEQRNDLECVLRPWSAGDLELEHRLMGDPEMMTFLGGPETREQSVARHERYLRLNESGPGRMFVIEAGPSRVAAGSVGFWEKDWLGQTVWETGWSVLPEFQGHGLASRATVAALAWARENGAHRFVHAFPSIDNAASNAVCRKAGFDFAGAFDFEYPPGTIMRCNDWSFDLFPTS